MPDLFPGLTGRRRYTRDCSNNAKVRKDKFSGDGMKWRSTLGVILSNTLLFNQYTKNTKTIVSNNARPAKLRHKESMENLQEVNTTKPNYEVITGQNDTHNNRKCISTILDSIINASNSETVGVTWKSALDTSMQPFDWKCCSRPVTVINSGKRFSADYEKQKATSPEMIVNSKETCIEC